MREYIIHKILIIFIIISFSIALVNAAEKVTLPTGQTIDLWLKNQRGEDTTTFYQNDEVWIVFYSPSTFTVFADFILNYPESRYPPLTLATNIQVSGSGQVISYRYLISPNDPGGLYMIRVIVKDTAGRVLGQVDLKYNLLVTPPTPSTPPTPPTPSLIPVDILLAGTIIGVIAIGAIVIFLFIRPKKAPPIPPSLPPGPPEVGTEVAAPGTQPISLGTVPFFAGLELPTGQMIPISSTQQEFGRRDFEKYISREAANVISRRHFSIIFDARTKAFYITDLGSTNGTLVNNEDIRGKGRVEIKDGDIISPAGVLNIRFKAS
jgi:hypothetical protein